MNDKTQIEISFLSIVKVVIVLLGLVFLWQIRDILILFFIVLVIVAALSPVVDKWSIKMNRIVAVSLIYIIMIAIIGGVSAIVFPPLVEQIQQLAVQLPDYLYKIFPDFGNWREIIIYSQEGLAKTAQEISQFGFKLFSATIGFFGGLIAVFTIIVLTFYLLLEQNGVKKFIFNYLPLENRERVISIAQKIGIKMGGWLRGQLMLGAIIGLIDGIGLGILGVDYALTLGVWAGFTELIPYIGPVLGAIPGVLLAFIESPLLGVLVLAFYVIVQQVEASFLVPKIMQKAVGLSPVIIIIAILIGAKVAGLTGVILSIPVAAIISVIFTEWTQIKKAVKS